MPPYAVLDQTISQVGFVQNPYRAAQQSAALQQGRRESQAVRNQVQQANYRTDQQNQRTAAVLNELAETKLRSDPREWWQWWGDYVDQHPEVRYATMERHARISQALLKIPPAALEKDTEVWSQKGRVPIHALQVGDLVLAQDPASRTLAYKAVIGISRSLQPLRGVQLSNGEVVQCSAGCVFWRARLGWWRAADLDDQSRLRGLHGDARVTQISELSVGETFEVEIADFSNLIIGQHGVLVHDRTRPQPVEPTKAVAAAK